MLKIKDKVANQGGHVGEVVSIHSKGCEMWVGVDFGWITRFCEPKDLKKLSQKG